MPSSTVEASEEFQLRTSQEEGWRFLGDLARIGSCIPGCESVTSRDDGSADFRVKLKVGYLSRTFELRAKLEEISPLNHLTFKAAGKDAEIEGFVDLAQSQGGTVTVRYRLVIRAISVTGKTALGMVGRDLVKRQASEFASCVKARLEGQEKKR